MNLLKCIMTHSTCYNGAGNGTPVGVLWHETAGGNPNLKRYVQPYEGDANYNELIAKLGANQYKNDWNHIYIEAGVNAWIGKLADGTIATVQTLPWDHRPWGCGSGSNGSCNGTDGGKFWIQFEICNDSYVSKDYFNKVYKEACEFTAYLCKLFSIDPNGTVDYNGVRVPTILCHADSYKLGLGSNHGDVYTWFNKFGKTMANVRTDVAKLIGRTSTSTSNGELYRVRKSWDDTKSQVGAYKNLNNAIAACPTGYKVFNSGGEIVYPKNSANTPYRVKVTVDALNINSGPSTSYSIAGCIRDYGVYTIIEEKDGFGLLKSKAGWISLEYTKKIQ